MSKEWKSPKTIIGPVARGEYYFARTEIVDEIWDELEKGNFILLAAPRRVGKTSILCDIELNPRNTYNARFRSVQAAQSGEEFYKTIYELMIECFKSSSVLGNWFSKYTKSRSITEISNKGVKIEKTDFPYLDEINSILNELSDEGETVVLLIDELPEVLHRLHKNGKKDEALSILSQLRVWRQNDYKKLQFVFAGSIGIHYVVKSITGRVSDINDLVKVLCAPLTNKEANEYIAWATCDATLQYSQIQKECLLQKIQYYFTPYFLNLMLDEIDKAAKKQGVLEIIITEKEINAAFDTIVKSSGYFKDWKKRLEDYMPKKDFLFVNEILTHIAHKDTISIQIIYDKAKKYNKETDYMDFISDLSEDGYITEYDGAYQFISPFLKSFWKINQPIYND